MAERRGRTIMLVLNIANTLGQQADYPLINTGANEKGEDVAHFSLPITADLFFNINQVVGGYR